MTNANIKSIDQEELALILGVDAYDAEKFAEVAYDAGYTWNDQTEMWEIEA